MTQLSLRLGLTRMSLLSRIAPAASTSPSFSRSIHPTHGANLEDNLQNKRSRSKRRKGVAGVAEQDEPLHTPWLEDMRVKEYENQQKRFVCHSNFIKWKGFKNESRLHHEIVAYINYILPTAEEETARRQVFSCVERVIKRRFPKCSVRIFGSVASGLCLPCGSASMHGISKNLMFIDCTVTSTSWSTLERSRMTLKINEIHCSSSLLCSSTPGLPMPFR